MNSRGGCCIAKYGGGGGGAYDISTVNRIMMKFRPIAPKPANGTSSSPEISETSPKSGRGRRRLSTTNNNNKRCNNRKRKEKKNAAVTLPLLPETPAKKESPAGQTKNMPTWLSFGSKGNGQDEMMLGMPHVARVVIGSCVTVECVTDTWVDVDGLWCRDREGRINLEKDKCPGFISDGYGRVTWTNEAYKKMVTDGEGGDGRGEVVVWLVMKDKATVTAALARNQAFTCRVRVQNQRSYGNGKEKSSITLPCDVWRIDGGGGGFAWRLDVTAALSLGR
ncbi:uncharacterized protein [Euphorbia lathyris]|uniref:uncharacterized protein n=1 Tax=Euphorbia lathyris TaxID=212925 RepID=UPI00331335EB